MYHNIIIFLAATPPFLLQTETKMLIQKSRSNKINPKMLIQIQGRLNILLTPYVTPVTASSCKRIQKLLIPKSKSQKADTNIGEANGNGGDTNSSENWPLNHPLPRKLPPHYFIFYTFFKIISLRQVLKLSIFRLRESKKANLIICFC